VTATRVSVELVPRSEVSLESDLGRLRERFPALDTVNVPDLLRFELRSTRACALAKRSIAHAIPHLRAMDYDRVGAFALAAALRSAGLDEVIVVQGDPRTSRAASTRPGAST
jgi:methylenetetrahydrofolate reductase (NADPH)